MRALAVAAVLSISGTAFAHPGHTEAESAWHFMTEHGWLLPVALVVGGALILRARARKQ